MILYPSQLNKIRIYRQLKISQKAVASFECFLIVAKLHRFVNSEFDGFTTASRATSLCSLALCPADIVLRFIESHVFIGDLVLDELELIFKFHDELVRDLFARFVICHCSIPFGKIRELVQTGGSISTEKLRLASIPRKNHG